MSYSKPPFPITSETVCASAPGKVILFGEHAVVYGYPAIAAALSDLRIFVWITPVYKSSDSNDVDNIHIILPDLPQPIDCTVSCRDVMDTLPSSSTVVPPVPHETAASLVQHIKTRGIKNNVNANMKNKLTTTMPLDDFSISALTPILYLFKVILLLAQPPQHRPRHGWKIYVSSQDLPVGAGLGSSAAFSVALAAALLQLASSSSTTAALPDLDTVNKYSYYAEILLHGQPSGLDNAVATYGGALQFHKTTANDQIHLQALPHFHKLSMLLVNTHIPRSTKALVAKVRALHTKYPDMVNPILQAMGEIAKAFGQQSSSSSHENAETLLDWVRLNHALLRAVGVSHDSLDSLANMVDACTDGAAAAKLTGAGGGGCALVVWSTEQARARVVEALQNQRQSYSWFSSAVGGQGVQWHDDPADIMEKSLNKSCSSSALSFSWLPMLQRVTMASLVLAAAGAVASRTLAPKKI